MLKVRAAALDRRLMSIYLGSSPVTQKWVQGHSLSHHYSCPLQPVFPKWLPCPLHEAQKYRCADCYHLGMRLCHAAPKRSTESLGTSTNHLSLSWDTFNWGKCMLHYLTHWKGRGDFLSRQRPQCSFPTHPMKRVLLKADKFKGWVLFLKASPTYTHRPGDGLHILPLRTAHCIPNSILRQPEGKLFANNAAESWPRPSSLPQGVATPSLRPTRSYCPLPLILTSHLTSRLSKSQNPTKSGWEWNRWRFQSWGSKFVSTLVAKHQRLQIIPPPAFLCLEDQRAPVSKWRVEE